MNRGDYPMSFEEIPIGIWSDFRVFRLNGHKCDLALDDVKRPYRQLKEGVRAGDFR